MSRFLCLFLALSVLLLAPPAFCQSAAPSSFAAVLSGSKYPLSLTLKDLDGSWRTFSLSVDTGTSSQINLYIALLTSGLQSTYFTRGETLALNGEIYLVTYHQKIKLDTNTLFKGESFDSPPAPKPTPDTALFLSLLNLRLVGSLNDIQAFSLETVLNPPAPPAPDPKEESVSNLKQIGLALSQYMQDNDEKLPPMKTTAVAKAALYPYIKSESVFVQPEMNKPYLPNTSLSYRSLASFSDPASMVIYYESDSFDGLRAILFLDGHVKRVTDADWQRLKISSHVPIHRKGYNSRMADSTVQEVVPGSSQDAEDRLGMTDAQWAQWQAYTHGYGDQDANGIDLSCLRQNLSLSPTERLRKHQRALRLVKEMRNAGTRAGLSRPPSGA